MGTDKALVPIEGISLLERTAQIALESGLSVGVAGRKPPPEWTLKEISFIEDEVKDCGPMGGLFTALKNTGTDILALACDMPRLSVQALQWLIEEHNQNTLEDGLITSSEEQLQPLFAVYTLRSLPLITECVESRSLAMHDLIRAGRFQFVTLPGLFASAVEDIDTPEILRALTGKRASESHQDK